MVAAGSGGIDSGSKGGYGGSLQGNDANSTYSSGTGGQQNQGGYGYVNVSFGKGGSNLLFDANRTSQDAGGGGGSGYYGGGTGIQSHCCGGGGGSSFISGHSGCNAINESSTEYNIIHTNQPIHYSGLFFTETKMIGGGQEMPLPIGDKGIGYLGSGAVRITSTTNPIPYSICTIKKSIKCYIPSYLVMTIILK